MIYRNETIFVGQGSNREAWGRAVARGNELATLHRLRDDWTPERWAETEVARLAMTGSCGRKLGALLDLTVLQFSVTFRRYNLNRRWNGKRGRGDEFDAREGAATAARLQADNPGANFVLLGKAVALAFELTNAPEFLDVVDCVGHKFLVFPHPSGINKFWNDPAAAQRARSALRHFVDLKPTHKTYVKT